ncbi:NAD-dependent epimerase/dehydratase family protein [Tardiphaga alba]|uniref:NAD-dependent epimerase/dehydratase family protein n=1 Tax=Tardiphaga alba TaxID=340268 RepID=A0ABX8A3D5_9BRAD|nr:NAD(P)H-binding protein [Tardiphaga alba]QUS38124.1 NAD-dependent epimerase/dehydratase family protein [Tardiphaga alba]
MTRILVVGASGLVGGHVITRALADDHITRVVAPTRRPLNAHTKLDNPLVDFDHLPAEADWWSVDGVICALGTTRAKAGSDEAFRTVDYDYPLAVARLAHRHGAARFALNSSLGADAGSRLLYPRTKGEIENAIKAVGFSSCTIVRPGLIGGDRDEFRLGERVAAGVLGIFGAMLPRRYRISPAEKIADALIDAAVTDAPGIHLIEADRLAGD